MEKKSINQDGFKTGFQIAHERSINIKHDIRAATTCKERVDNAIEAEIKKPLVTQVRTGSSSTPPPRAIEDKPRVRVERLGRISVQILEIIRDNGAVTNHEICYKLNKNNNYVKRYLYNLQEYRFIYRNNDNWKWYLRDLDNDFFVSLDNMLCIIYNGETTVKQKVNNGETIYKVGDVSPLNNNHEIKTEEIKQEQETKKSLKTQQLSLIEILQRVQQERIEREGVLLLPSEIENEIIMNLASWCDKTQEEGMQRAYKHYESAAQFANEIGYSLAEVRTALSSLDDKGFIYTVSPSKDKYGQWKIGFTQEFMEKVRNR